MRVILCVPDVCRYFLTSKQLFGPLCVQRSVARIFLTRGSVSSPIANQIKMWICQLASFARFDTFENQCLSKNPLVSNSTQKKPVVGNAIGARRWRAETRATSGTASHRRYEAKINEYQQKPWESSKWGLFCACLMCANTFCHQNNSSALCAWKEVSHSFFRRLGQFLWWHHG